jgi:hypothetical protein
MMGRWSDVHSSRECIISPAKFHESNVTISFLFFFFPEFIIQLSVI